MRAALLAGLGFGFLVAAQVGPVWLLCARSSLRHGARIGLSIGAGAALIDLVYAALGVAGAARLLTVAWLRPALGLGGAGVLIWLGARSLWTALRVRMGAETPDDVATPLAAFRLGLIATASNPLTIASWAAIFAAASVGGLASDTTTTLLLLAGVGVGSASWFALLAVGMGLLARRAGPRLLVAVDGLSGAGLVAFGGLLGWRAVRGD
jgi:putative LysE/RhtB family amino acid efflux pump